MSIADIRLHGHQLAEARFGTPRELVSWMGALQAQDYAMVKWAVGLRLKNVSPAASRRMVEEALSGGKILRLHIMRPTWHLVPGEDVRWMLKLSARRIRQANESFGKSMGIDGKLYLKCNRLLERILSGNRNMTKGEIGAAMEKAGLPAMPFHVSRFLFCAETDGIVCSGPDKGGKCTYALLDERVPVSRDLSTEEALAVLAGRYFQSHSPAAAEDFLWWSGLSVTQVRQAVELIKGKLVKERFRDKEFFVHDACCRENTKREIIHFLPPYDEYLIGYKDRTGVLEAAHHSRAFNRWGIFYPVILHNGRIVGNWTRVTKKGEENRSPAFFDQECRIFSGAVEEAAERYRQFSAG